MSVLGLDLGYAVKYNPLPLGVPLGFALGNSFRQRVYLTIYPSSRPNTDTVYPDSSQNKHSHFSNIGSTAVVSYAAVTAVAANVYPSIPHF